MCKSKDEQKWMQYGRALHFANEIDGRELFDQAVQDMSGMIDLEEYRAYAEKMEDRYREVMHTRQSFEMWEEMNEQRDKV